MFQFLGNPPFFTFSIFVLCILFILFRPDILSTCLIPASILSPQQLPRLFLYPFVHAGFFHLLLNMLAWMTMTKDFEHTVGTLPAAFTVLMLLLPCNTLIQTAASYLLDFIFRTGFKYNCSVGLSGALFSILVITLRLSGQSHASFFGFFAMPVTVYPFVLAGLIQLILPGASLLAHCSGILSGTALARGWLRAVTPSDDRFDAVETKLRLVNLPAWQPVPSMFGHLFENVADHLLPGRSGVTPPTLRERTASAWRAVSAWFSSSSPSSGNTQQQQQNQTTSQPQSATRGGVYMTGSAAGTSTTVPSEAVFSGTGHTLGGSSASQPQGRIPPNSRLLMLAEQQSNGGDMASGYGATEAKSDSNATGAR